MGGSDCELLREGWLAQPANAWSSVAYLVAAAYVLARRGSADRRRWLAVPAAVALALVFLGSAAYHGPQPSWAGAAHDASIAALGVVVLFRDTGPGRRRLGGLLLLLAAVAAVVAAPRLVLATHVALASAVAVVELRRRRRRTSWPSVADRVAVTALALGAVLFVLGRTGGPLCSPSSVAQLHAGWHVATAVAAAAALGRRPHDAAPGPSRGDR